ncbi:MAG: hypothetical protein HY232_17790 [Acidobacteria bacterium]|nr:hypothetical protein [Acidobacteriota bacterium]
MMYKRRTFLWAVSLLMASLVWTSDSWAQVPNSISYSGLLTNTQGEPREGQFNLTFRIYDRPVGGTLLHQQAIPNVVVRKGQFSVLLGPFSDSVFLPASGDRYVEVQVGNDPPLLPRQQLTSVPFAQRAASVDGARGGSIIGGLSVSGNVGIGTTTPSTKLEVHNGAIGITRSDTGRPNVQLGLATGERWIYGMQGDGRFDFTNNPADWDLGRASVMTLKPNGSVGIGTTIPTARLHVIGNFIATGSKSALVETPSYGKRQIYAVESPENWFEDFGKAKLSDGQAVVKLDSIFAETVNTENDYHIFLTPQGDCEGLYVANKTVASFEVRELRKGKSAIEFDYRIIAKRKGFEQVRLEEIKSRELRDEKK